MRHILACFLFLFVGTAAGRALWSAGTASPLSNEVTRVDSTVWPQLVLSPLVDGLALPVHIANAGDGSGRLYVVEQAGRIRLIENGRLRVAPFLDISDRITCCGERGLLSVAFPPDYSVKRYFYVDYTDRSGNTVVARYRLAETAYAADPASEQVILHITQPYSNHNGGQLAFSPRDGYLYVGMGDGGSGGDPENRAQNPAELLGKLLRIDVESGQTPYSIPVSNPFTQTAAYRPEIWALGVRNPWRFSFDRATSDLFIGDVGQNAWEEVDWQPAAWPGGANYGWRVLEGSHCFNPSLGCDPPAGYVSPVAEYNHGPDDSVGCSITGGAVYRGTDYPRMLGLYFYGDYCSGKIWGLRHEEGVWQALPLLDTGYEITTFGEDEAGNIYLADYAGGAIYLLSDAAAGKKTYLPAIVR